MFLTPLMTGLAAGYSWLVLKRLFALRLSSAAYLASTKEPGRSAILWILLPPIQLCTAHPLGNGDLASRVVLFLMFVCPVIVWRACQAQLNCVYCDLTWCCVCVWLNFNFPPLDLYAVLWSLAFLEYKETQISHLLIMDSSSNRSGRSFVALVCAMQCR